MTDKDNIQRYVDAGYTHLVEYETWAPILKIWAYSRIPTTADAVVLHESACSIRVRHGEIRDVRITLLSIVLTRHENEDHN